MIDWKACVLSGLAIVAFTGLAGCGDSDVKRFVELDTMKAQAYKDGGDDCDKVAKNYADWKSKYGKEYKDLQNKLSDKFKDKAAGEKALGADKDKMDANKKAVVDGLMKCMGNDAYKKAVEAD